ncbi:CRISPR/Cas system CSM-associated protein Csm3 (group 7 of RAMP superfamily) [Anoxybacillus tepidamans]|uniref:CRISPR/Cas system CSM-associated protein Csm3 (Group 7 of RAMP superfamily) n=1 Tax=Anoxybacteroides tepidamans TaxID=265948 RepID=A0A7W8MV24_9BACL|nr:RAMP superfamily CRISPR-associated protein [Anoxybacillus tepidamans]MBB5325137.1 CRISPR/Cas system CSM-associated protein Csm3 (group 7 of RAMP superfamily) [Anoxybacillus tepidamans]
MGHVNDRIVMLIFVKGIFELTSPCLIGSGKNEQTDIDFMRNHEGKAFIPGTTLAGVFRNYLVSRGIDRALVAAMFGQSIEENGETTLSRLFVSDAHVLGNCKNCFEVRDGVRLDHKTKTAIDLGKFDYEVVKKGTKFLVKLECVFRECDDIAKLQTVLFYLLDAMQKEKVVLGAKKQRGFGNGKLRDVQILLLDFTKEDKKQEYIEQWIHFDWGTFTGNINVDELDRKVDLGIPEEKTMKIKVPLQNVYSLMIRNYRNSRSFAEKSVDYTQLCSDGVPIVPGTSWAGAFRHRMKTIMEQLYESAGRTTFSDLAREKINDLFGYVDEQKKQSKISRIRFHESVISKGKFVKNARVKIDRFTGGAAGGALFDELPLYGGDTQLVIEIKEAKDEDIGLLLLALKDLMKGYLAIGGETSIGKGIFSGSAIFLETDKGEVQMNENKEQDYFRALYNAICQSK